MVKIIKSLIVKLFVEIIGTEDIAFYDQIFDLIISDCKNTFYNYIIELNTEIIKNSPPPIYTRNVIFSVNNVIISSISVNCIKLLMELLDQRYPQNMPVLMFLRCFLHSAV